MCELENQFLLHFIWHIFLKIISTKIAAFILLLCQCITCSMQPFGFLLQLHCRFTFNFVIIHRTSSTKVNFSMDQTDRNCSMLSQGYKWMFQKLHSFFGQFFCALIKLYVIQYFHDGAVRFQSAGLDIAFRSINRTLLHNSAFRLPLSSRYCVKALLENSKML